MAALDWIFGRPILSGPMLFRQTHIPERTARRLLAVLRDNGVIRDLAPASGRRSRLLVFPDPLNIAVTTRRPAHQAAIHPDFI